MTDKNPNQLHYDELFKHVKNSEREAFREKFLKLHERDQADFFHELYPDNKRKISQLLEPNEFAEFFEYMDEDSQWQAIESMPDEYLEETFHYVPDDELADFIEELELEEQNEVFDILSPPTLELMEELLSSDEDSASSVMTTKFISVAINDTADEVISQMRTIGKHSELIYYMYCVDEENRLQGVVSLRDLILSPGDQKIEDIMNSHPVYVDEDADQEEAAKIISDYDLLALPVVDSNNVLLGIITVDDVVDILQDEMTEDFHKFSGIVTEDDDELDTISSMTKQRLPWIVILIFLGIISANLINFFEDTLSKIVALATFMPIMLDSAGNVGTQALAVAVRKLTMGERDKESFFQMLAKEFFTGIIIGIVSGVVLGIISYFMYGNIILGLIVGFSLAVTLSLSTVIGYAVPNLFHKIGIDPAVASGPFITTICDTFALVVYFSLATYLISYF